MALQVHLGREGDLATGASYSGDATVAGFGALWIGIGAGAPPWLFKADVFETSGAEDYASPTMFGPLSVTRQIRRPDGHSVGYVDAILNISDQPQDIDVLWGGAFYNRRSTLADDRFVLSVRAPAYAIFSSEAPGRPADPQMAIVTGIKASIVDPASVTGTLAYPGPDPTVVAARHHLRLAPGERAVLVHDLVVRRPQEAAATFASRVDALATQPSEAEISLRAGAANWTGPVAPPPKEFVGALASIAETQAAIAAGRITIADLAELHLGRIAAYDKGPEGFNAFITVAADTLARARSADTRLARGEPMRPLEGVFVAVKDSIDVAGLPTSLGLPALADTIPATDASVVARLKAAGAIIIGKTNLDELIAGGAGRSTLGGQTRNVFDRRRSPGGSSGGSAVAVAAGMATVALGSDTCDSLSNPAGLSGLATLRGTHGSVAADGVLPNQVDRDIVGALARSVADLEAVHRVIADPLRSQRENNRIAVLGSEFVGFPNQAAAGDAVRAVVARSGLTFVSSDTDWRPLYRSIRRPLSTAQIDAYIARLTSGGIRTGEALLAKTGGRLRPASRQILGAQPPAQMSPDEIATRVTLLRRQLIGEMDARAVAGFAYPANLVTASLIGVDRYPDSTCALSSQTGFPQITVSGGRIPSTTSSVGISIVGRPGSESELFALARRLEAAAAPNPPLDLPKLISTGRDAP